MLSTFWLSSHLVSAFGLIQQGNCKWKFKLLFPYLVIYDHFASRICRRFFIRYHVVLVVGNCLKMNSVIFLKFLIGVLTKLCLYMCSLFNCLFQTRYILYVFTESHTNSLIYFQIDKYKTALKQHSYFFCLSLITTNV